MNKKDMQKRKEELARYRIHLSVVWRKGSTRHAEDTYHRLNDCELMMLPVRIDYALKGGSAVSLTICDAETSEDVAELDLKDTLTYGGIKEQIEKALGTVFRWRSARRPYL